MTNPVENQLNHLRRSTRPTRTPNPFAAILGAFGRANELTAKAELSVAVHRAKQEADFEQAQRFQKSHRDFIQTLPDDLEAYEHTPLGGLSFRRNRKPAQAAPAASKSTPAAEPTPAPKPNPIKDVAEDIGLDFSDKEKEKDKTKTPQSLFSDDTETGTPSMFTVPSMFADHERDSNVPAPAEKPDTKPWWVGSGQGRDPGLAWQQEEKAKRKSAVSNKFPTTANEILNK